MSSDATVGIIGAVTGAAIGAVAIIVISLINIYIEGKRAKIKANIEYHQERKIALREQLTEFYDPIYTLLSVNQSIFFEPVQLQLRQMSRH